MSRLLYDITPAFRTKERHTSRQSIWKIYLYLTTCLQKVWSLPYSVLC